MATTESLQIELAERPEGQIIPGKTFRQVKVKAPTADDLKDGELLLETLYLSLDPAMRGWISENERSYMLPVRIGEVMRGGSVARVVASNSPKAKKGDLVFALTGFREVVILPDSQVEIPLHLPPNARTTDIIGCLGLTGLTAYFGMNKLGQPKPGDTVVVSGAAGATGSVAAQIARILGAKLVVGIAGSDDKCKWLTEELGLDVALNYKDPDFKDKFKNATPEFIDVYWDNVGGEILDLCLARANKHARFVACGAISEYNTSVPKGIKNYFMIIAQRIRMEGFIVFDFLPEYPQGRRQLAQWLGEGKLKRQEHILKGGLAVAEEGLLKLFRGDNTGKMLVEVKNL